MMIEISKEILKQIEALALSQNLPKEIIIEKALQKYLYDEERSIQLKTSADSRIEIRHEIPEPDKDISEKIAGYNEIKNSEARFNAIFNSMTDAIIFSNTERRIILVNPAFTRMFGYEPWEAIGKTTAFLYENNESYFIQRKKYQHGDIDGHHLFEITLQRKNGELIPIETLGLPVRNYKNEIIGYMGIHRDISDRKKTESELIHSVSLLRATLDSTADAILVIDNTGIVKIFNNRFIELWKTSKEELGSGDNSKTLNFIVNRLKDPVLFILKTEQLWENKLDECFELLETIDGRIFESYSGPQLVNGEPVGRVWCFRDITERKKTERALQESEERYRSLYENIPIGLYRTTPDGKVLLSNPALLNMLGYSSGKEFRDRNLESGFYEPNYSRKDFVAIMEKYDEIKGYESPWTKRDGSQIFLRENAKVIRDEHNNVQYYEGSVEDITEHKRNEEKIKKSELQFRLIWEKSFDGMLLIDKNGIIIMVNYAFCYMAEKTKSEIEGYPVSILYVPEQHKEILNAIIFQFKTKNIQSHEERELELWNGKKKWFELSNSFIELDNDEIFLLSIFRDITERKNAEADKLRLQNLESLGILTGGILHDFRNILTVIKGQASILDIKIKDEKIRKSVLSITEAANTAVRLTNQLYNFAKGELPNKSLVLINNLLEEISSAFSGDPNIKFKFDFEGISWAEVDSLQMKQAINNIIINARESMPKGGVIRISTEMAREDDKTYLKIKITDSGCGIPEENISRIFDPYFTTKIRDNKKGSGLGLSISHSIIKNHGGKINVFSKIESGTTFEICIPINKKSPKPV
jgi:PAS domain S-box-containing protein